MEYFDNETLNILEENDKLFDRPKISIQEKEDKINKILAGLAKIHDKYEAIYLAKLQRQQS